MADDLIHCPSCGFQLRLPAELYGTTVECPQCHSHFTAPVPAARSASDRPPTVQSVDADHTDYVGERDEAPRSGGGIVIVPGICLLIVSLLQAFFYVRLITVFLQLQHDPALFNQALQEALDKNPNLQAAEREQLKQGFAIARDFGPAVTGALLGLNLLTALGAVMMLMRRGYWLALLGTIVALNPVSACCFLQVPFGIWGLIVLLGDSGRRAFR